MISHPTVTVTCDTCTRQDAYPLTFHSYAGVNGADRTTYDASQLAAHLTADGWSVEEAGYHFCPDCLDESGADDLDGVTLPEVPPCV